MEIRHESTLIKGEKEIKNLLPELVNTNLIPEILEGLTATEKYISSKFFYDEKGSELFEQITLLPEYYPTITEKKILMVAAIILAEEMEGRTIIEIGSGDFSKISILFDAVSEKYHSAMRYVPLDISETAIKKSSALLQNKFKEIKVEGLVADFMSQMHLVPDYPKRTFCFFGSTIGNLTRKQSLSFIGKLSEIMQPGDELLLGLDMVKPIEIVEKAYNDSQKITEKFNRNILKVMNRLASLDFNPEQYEHLAFYNSCANRIEMHLKAKKDTVVSVGEMSKLIKIRKGETIKTENSHKFTRDNIFEFAMFSGLKVDEIFSDKKEWFSLVRFKKN